MSPSTKQNQTYEMSKTYQYRKVMKPLLERKRRARINKCLDELKDLLAEHLQQINGENPVKVEKADILEITVQHFRQLKAQKHQPQDRHQQRQHFRSGYIQAANEVSRCLAFLPRVDVALGTHLMTHLGERLNQLEETFEDSNKQNMTPLEVNCGARTNTPLTTSSCCSPVSSGYCSDDADRSLSPASSSSSSPSSVYNRSQAASVRSAEAKDELWRPW